MVRRANFYNQNRDPDANWLTLDVGNFVDRGSRGKCTPKCDLMLRAYRVMGYDVLGLGQMELAMGADTLAEIMDTLGIPLVCANVVDVRTRKPIAKPYYIRRYGNMVIGITGLIYSELGRYSKVDTTQFQILPYLDVAQTLIPRLARKVDAVILLCDFRNKELDTLLQVAPEVDLIITNGTLRPASKVTRSGNTLLVATSSSGYNGTALTLEFNPAWGDSLGFDFVSISLTDEYHVDNVISPLIASWKAESSVPKKTAPKKTAPKPAKARPISPKPALPGKRALSAEAPPSTDSKK